MNLIEELGLEKCQAIVDGAPVGTTDYSNEDCEIIYYQKTNNVIFWDSECGMWDEVYFMMPELKSLSDLRTAIADHERTDTCSDIKNHLSPNTKVIEG